MMEIGKRRLIQAERARERDEAERRDAASWVRRTPAWALSVALHLVVGVVLMNVVYFTQHDRLSQVFRISLAAPARPPEPAGGLEQGDQDNGINGKDSEDSAPAKIPADATASTASLPEIRKPAPIAPLADASNVPLAVTGPPVVKGPPASGPAPEAGLGGVYVGRGGAGRGKALREHGGDAQSEQAVLDGLDWLARHQDPDGKWRSAGFGSRCPKNDRCGGDGYDTYTGAVTGLAVLAFLGDGITPFDAPPPNGDKTPDYAPGLKKALDWLRSQQERTGAFNGNLYVHGIASLAMTEAAAITQDPKYRESAQNAVRFICETQEECGGWNYAYGSGDRGDTSITSWQVMALRSARTAGLAVPEHVWAKAKEFEEKVTDADGLVAYSIGAWGRTPGCHVMTAIGLATRAYLGMTGDAGLMKAMAKEVLRVPPRYDTKQGTCPNWGGAASYKTAQHWSLYYTYYATLALFHQGGDAWAAWNPKMRLCTLEAQRKAGHAKGSWNPVVWDGQHGGRVYCTALNVMNLEVYYRYLPSYEVGSELGLAQLLSDADWEAATGQTPRWKAPVAAAEPAAAGSAEPYKMPEATRKSLIEDLKAADMMTRMNAARTLSWTRDETLIPPMLEAAKAEATSLRVVLIGYLADMPGNADALDFFISELDSERAGVKSAAVAALKKSTGAEAGETRASWERWRDDRKK